MTNYDNPRSRYKVIHWPLSKVTQTQHFKLFFLKKAVWSYAASMGCWDEFCFKCSGSPSHMTKMDSRPIYVWWSLKKFLSSEPRGWLSWNLVYSIGHYGTTKFVYWFDLDHFFRHGQICFLLLHRWKLIQHIVMYFQSCSYALRWAIQVQWSSFFMKEKVQKLKILSLVKGLAIGLTLKRAQTLCFQKITHKISYLCAKSTYTGQNTFSTDRYKWNKLSIFVR